MSLERYVRYGPVRSFRKFIPDLVYIDQTFPLGTDTPLQYQRCGEFEHNYLQISVANQMFDQPL